MKNIKNGLIYFYIHLIIEIVSFYVTTKYLSIVAASILSIVYDFLAFVPQGLFGFILDKNKKIPFLFIGIVISLLSLVFMGLNLNAFIVVSTVALGNALIHICGAERTLRTSEGKMTNPALFVAGGSFGLILGKIASIYNLPISMIVAILLTLLIPAFYYHKNKIDYSDYSSLEKFNYSNTKINPIIVIVLAVLVVAVRAFIGYGIPTSWNQELYQAILLYFSMGIGKALGGILIDKIGIKLTSIISTLGAIPFLLCGDQIMLVSIFGVMMFSMTMAITLAILVSVMKKYPGLAFGCTTIGLFLGTLPIFIIRFSSFIVTCILISIMSLLCLLALLYITPQKGRKDL